MIGSMYFINMGIVPDNWLSCASAYRNHYDIPVTGNKRSKVMLPYSNNPVKSAGETENRLLSSYATIRAMAELRERSASRVSHEHVYKSILMAKKPTDIECCVDRNVVPFKGDSPVNLMSYVFTTLGGRLSYEDNDK